MTVTADPRPVEVDVPVTFAASVSGTAVSPVISWEFGDGELGDGPIVRHTYKKDGLFTARATATASGDVATATIDVFVTAVQTPPKGCGCGAGGFEPTWALGLLALVRLRRVRATSRAS